MIYLASRSPRRVELLRQLGLEFETLAIDVDEASLEHEAAEAYVCRIAKAKADSGKNRLSGLCSDFVVLGADTIICIDDKIIGKPEDAEHCRCLLAQLSGRTHQVLTAIALNSGGATEVRLSVNRVRFRPIEAREIDVYCASNEPADKAGAYAIQGKAAIFIEHLEGSYSSVMGLPLFETAEILKQAGISVLDI